MLMITIFMDKFLFVLTVGFFFLLDNEPEKKKVKTDEQLQQATAVMVPGLPGAVPVMPVMPLPGMPLPPGFPQVPFGHPIPGEPVFHSPSFNRLERMMITGSFSKDKSNCNCNIDLTG